MSPVGGDHSEQRVRPLNPVGGEYGYVALNSRDMYALKEAHETSITRPEAERMLRDLAARYLKPEQAAALVIRWGSRSGRGGTHAPRKRVPAYTRSDGTVRYRMKRTGEVVPYVSLPTTPLAVDGLWWGPSPRGKRRVTSRLRVGLVLHEFAHVIVPTAGHGPWFVGVLDNLVEEWRATR